MLPDLQIDDDPEPAPRLLPRLVTARELCARPDPVDGDRLLGPLLLRGSRTVVGAQTGQGKSTFCTAVVAAYTESREFLGWTGEGGRALMIDLEQGERTAKKRLREAGLDESDQVALWLIPDGLELDTSEEQRAELEQELAVGGYGVVVIDPHYKAHGGDTNEERDVKRLMGHLDRWRANYEFSLVLPTHARKPPAGGNGKLTMHDIAAGSGAILRGAEVVLALEIAKPGVTRLHAFKHRDGDDELPLHDDPWTLSFSRERGYQRIDTSSGERKAAAEDIAEWIRARGGRATPGEIRDIFGIVDDTLRNRRAKLAELGIEYRADGANSEYADPAICPAPRAPRLSRGNAIAGTEPLETWESSPAPRDPAKSNGAGSGKRSEQGKRTAPRPAPTNVGSPPAAGQGQPPASAPSSVPISSGASETLDGLLDNDPEPAPKVAEVAP